ncbi:methionine aminopeptidase 1D, mitochondrial-like [Saccostrea cucullata]|uniref:methionine aminopeptidase 1D, mitochondrial-like n=1 Tax=Saccostrea cuccullata TaxID=36930 RepID=UPI002ED28756
MRGKFTYCVYHAAKAHPMFSHVLSRVPTMNKQIKRGKFSIVLPHKTTPTRVVPSFIQKPPYAVTGVVGPKPVETEIKNEEQIQTMRNTCRLARKILDSAGKQLKAGMTTDEIDEYIHEMCIDNGAYPSPLLYNNYPKSICTSVNNVACHGIPDLRPLEDGDIINVDVTIYKDGMHGDVSKTYMIGSVDDKAKQLVKVTEQCLYAGIEQCRPGQKIIAIGTAIRDLAESHGFSVIPAFCGHGIGSVFHSHPEIMHIPLGDYDSQHEIMKEGMTFTIEPILSEGTDMVAILEDDGWTAVSEDGSRSAQFEHTILVTSDGCEILTVSEEEIAKWGYKEN